MRIIRLFKGHVKALLAVLALLVITANADLALPNYMSEIVDVGIQQGGIESPVPDTIRAQSLSDLEMFMGEGDRALVEGCYGPADAEGVRTFQGTREQRSADGDVAEAMGLPETAVLALGQGVDASALGAEGMPGGAPLTLDQLRAAHDAGMVTGEQLAANVGQMADSMGSMAGSLVSLRACAFVRAV